MKRQACKAEIDLSYFNGEHHWEGCLLNINPKGGYLETTQPITQRTAVLIRVLSCENSAAHHANGLCSNAVAEVKWCRNLHGGKKIAYGVGFKYCHAG